MVCGICGSKVLSRYYTQGQRDQFVFYRCGRCGGVTLDSQIEPNQEKYAEHITDPFDLTKRTNRWQTGTYQYIRRVVRSRGRVLDIGCGNGRLLHLLRLDGFEVRGLELSSRLAQYVGEHLDIPVETGNFLEYHPTGRFDLVILRHVLEHLPDPVAAMLKIRRLLEPDGQVVLEFPNIEALEMRFKRYLRKTGFYRKRYSAGYVPGHCHEFCRKSFEALCLRTGLRIQDWTTYSNKSWLNRLYRIFPVGSKVRTLVRALPDQSDSGVFGP